MFCTWRPKNILKNLHSNIWEDVNAEARSAQTHRVGGGTFVALLLGLIWQISGIVSVSMLVGSASVLLVCVIASRNRHRLVSLRFSWVLVASLGSRLSSSHNNEITAGPHMLQSSVLHPDAFLLWILITFTCIIDKYFHWFFTLFRPWIYLSDSSSFIFCCFYSLTSLKMKRKSL